MTPLAYLKIAAIAALAVLLFGSGWYVRGLRATVAADANHAIQLKALAAAWESRELQVQSQGDRYVKEINALKDGMLTYASVAVRLCPSAPDPAVPGRPADADRAPAAGVLPGEPREVPRFDVGPFLFDQADRADEIVADCRRTQP